MLLPAYASRLVPRTLSQTVQRSTCGRLQAKVHTCKARVNFQADHYAMGPAPCYSWRQQCGYFTQNAQAPGRVCSTPGMPT